MEKEENLRASREISQDAHDGKSDDEKTKLKIADYFITRMPKEAFENLDADTPLSQVLSYINGTGLTDSDARQRQENEKDEKPLTLAGAGGEDEKNPFIRGFMRAIQDM